MDDTTAQAKREARVAATQLIRDLALDRRRSFDRRVCDHVLASAVYRDAVQVLGYSALTDEVNVWPVLEKAHEDGKAVFLPVTNPDDWSMAFRRWQPGVVLERSETLGVVEPLSDESPREMPSLALVPGRAFDPHGHRLGRGKGCYDRVLEGVSRAGILLGVAYDVQRFSEIPVDVHDRPLDAVVTESGIFSSPG